MGLETKLRAPGLRWLVRGNQRIARWVCSKRISARGYPVKTQRLWAGHDLSWPTEEEFLSISKSCSRLQEQMIDWDKNREQRSKISRDTGLIYFLQSGDLVKIGFSIDARARAIALRSISPVPLELLGTIPGTVEIERFVHWLFRHTRRHGEWFDLDDTLRAFIAAHAKRPEQSEYLVGDRVTTALAGHNNINTIATS